MYIHGMDIYTDMGSNTAVLKIHMYFDTRQVFVFKLFYNKR